VPSDPDEHDTFDGHKSKKTGKEKEKRNKGGKEEQIPVDFSEYTDVQLAVGCG